MSALWRYGNHDTSILVPHNALKVLPSDLCEWVIFFKWGKTYYQSTEAIKKHRQFMNLKIWRWCALTVISVFNYLWLLLVVRCRVALQGCTTFVRGSMWFLMILIWREGSGRFVATVLEILVEGKIRETEEGGIHELE